MTSGNVMTVVAFATGAFVGAHEGAMEGTVVGGAV